METLSLVLVTRGRTRETECFLRSLHDQDVQAELILVDQNHDDRLERIIEAADPPFPLVRVHSAPGLCRGRNAGLAHASGAVVAFPDDDCAYPPGVLARVLERLRERPDLHGVTGRAEDEAGRPMLRFPSEPRLLRRGELGRTAVSCTIFLRRTVADGVGDFDVTLGPGSGTPWTAADEADYLLRALERGFRIEYQPDIVVTHPHPLDHPEAALLSRVSGYARANGRVWRRHSLPLRSVARGLLGPALRSCVLAARGRRLEARYHWGTFRGRLEGWLRA